jgi:GNAT superfamily N-acetyltransferase
VASEAPEDLTFAIRLAAPADVPALRRLIDRSVRGLNQSLYTTEQVDSALIYVFGVDTQLIADATYFVVEAGGEIVAAGGWSRRRTLFGGDQHKSGHDSLLDPAHDAARIRAFFVDPAWARRGLARLLFEACRDAARAHGFAAMELGSTLPGEALYRALGFAAHERVEVSMPNGVSMPVIRMTRDI